MIKKYLILAVLILGNGHAFAGLESIVPKAFIAAALSVACLKTGFADEATKEEIERYLDIDEMITLHDDAACKDVIAEVIETYSPNEKNINFYGDDLSDENKPQQVLAHPSSKSIYLNGTMTQIVSAPIREEYDTQEEFDAAKKEFMNLQEFRAAKVILGHEIKQVHDNTPRKIANASNAMNVATTLGFGAALMVSENGLMYAIPAAIAKYYIDKMFYAAYSRRCKRNADKYAIAHTTNSADLDAVAERHAKLAAREKVSLLKYYLEYTAPTHKERAAYFQKAATNLKN